MEVKIGQKIWLMISNKPVEITVSKITDMTEMADEGEIIITKREVFISFTKEYLHDLEIYEDEVFETKEQLMSAVFELEKSKQKEIILEK